MGLNEIIVGSEGGKASTELLTVGELEVVFGSMVDKLVVGGGGGEDGC